MATTMESRDAAPPAAPNPATFTFMSRVLSDMSGAIVSVLCSLGDRLGLLKALAEGGPATSAELAARTGLAERYVREWLCALTSAGYLAYNAESGRFTLPPEHAPVLAHEGGPLFLGGAHEQLPGLFGGLDDVTRAFRDGGGVAPERFPDHLREGMERLSVTWFENLLVPVWIPAVPGLRERLEAGATVADIGCGGGSAVLALAHAFPNSRFVGYDSFAPSVERARIRAGAAELAHRVRFEVLDAEGDLGGPFDLVTAFHVVHDAADPVRVLEAVRRALAPGGTVFVLESNCSDKVEENRGPPSTILYGTSVLYCTPISIAAGGEGLGTLGLPEPRLRDICARAGFAAVRRLPEDNPFNALYQLRVEEE